MKSETMRVLTVRQPWASLIVLGHKPIENRHWSTEYRGDVAILAGKGFDLGERARQAYWKHIAKGNIPLTMVAGAIVRMINGGVIGVAELHDVTRASDSWWFTGPAGLCLRRPRLVRNKEGTATVIKMAGNLSMFKAEKRDEAIIRAHLGEKP